MSSTNDNDYGHHINTRGGSYVEGGVQTGGGDYAGRDKNVEHEYRAESITINQYIGSPRALTAEPTQSSKRHDFYAHISLPPNYVVREELLSEIRSAVLTDTRAVALTSTIKSKPTAPHGMGGIGKSVMARALCDDPQIQARFKDGILWTTLGQSPDVVARLREWLTALGGTINEAAPSIDTLRARLAELVSGRAFLLIVDDVWQLTHLEVFPCLCVPMSAPDYYPRFRNS